MKKFLFVLLTVCGIAFAQQKPTIAVYVTGDVPENDKKALGTRMLSALVNSERYVGIERTDAFLSKIEQEHVKQRSGAVNDNQISDIGKQFGVKYICIADITPAFGAFQLSARIVDVETAQVTHIADAFSTLKTVMDVVVVSNEVVRKMFGGGQSTAKPAAPKEPPKIAAEPQPQPQKPAVAPPPQPAPRQTVAAQPKPTPIPPAQRPSQQEKNKTSPVMLALRASTAVIAAGGIGAAIYYNKEAKNELDRYNNATDGTNPNTLDIIIDSKQKAKNHRSNRDLFNCIGAAGAAAFTVTLFF